ncbi:hypothetical protein L1987_10703 [Smallanthus sonchifolius]|uniref:Uncharacterized protein n=1 Tax=Smallanthus sonchifolius TaxID=185202 RepID=A0ACB9JB53_9ASTR|nr:hypothetical protein L1987_10703 [Smallanthus sonchifolius]
MSCLHYRNKVQSSWPEFVCKRVMYGGDSSRAGDGSGGRGNNEALTRMTRMMMSVAPPQPVMVVGGVGDTKEFSRRDERVPMWSQQKTRDFIAIRDEIKEGLHDGKEEEEPVGGGCCLISC